MTLNFTFHGLAMDAGDVETLVRFWCAAAGYVVTREAYPYVAVLGVDDQAPSSLPRIIILQVPEGKTAKNRLHMEFSVSDLDAETERLVGLGATLVAKRQFYETHWHVLQDPEGNEFCLVREQAEE